MQGESLLNAFHGEEKDRKGPIFWEWSGGQAILDDGWKLVKWGEQAPWELYHVASDPAETEDLALKETGKVTELESAFRRWKEETIR
jgi:arylsulfatase A-like enzyme